MEYISENHSKHLLMCHLIFVCKYRKKLLLKVGDDIKTEVVVKKGFPAHAAGG